MLNWPVLKYHPVQYAYWASRARFNFLPCGRQSGKTELAMRKLVRHLPVKRPWDDPRYFFGSPTYRQAKKVAWNRMLRLIPKDWISDISLSELSITTVFGSELFLLGLDKPERAEGLILDGGVIDECSDIKPKTFDLSILPTLVHRNGWTDFIGVPKRFGAGVAEYREKCKKAEKKELPDSDIFAWPSEGIVPDEYLELCRATMDIRDFEEQFNGTWLTASGEVFHAFDSEYNVRPCSYDPNRALIVGMDFNVNPLCWIFCQMNGASLDVVDEMFIRNTNTPEALKVMLSRYAEHKGHFQIYGDASSRGRRTSAYHTDYQHIVSNMELKALGRTLHFDRGNPPVADRFAETNARICSGDGQRHVFIDPNCEHLILDLESRGYKPGTREADDSAQDSGHMTDALGYIIHKRWPLQTILANNQIITIIKGT